MKMQKYAVSLKVGFAKTLPNIDRPLISKFVPQYVISSKSQLVKCLGSHPFSPLLTPMFSIDVNMTASDVSTNWHYHWMSAKWCSTNSLSAKWRSVQNFCAFNIFFCPFLTIQISRDISQNGQHDLKNFCLKCGPGVIFWYLQANLSLSPTQPLGPMLLKIFTSLIYELLYKARVFVPGKPFQLSLLFVNKVKSLP